MNQILENYFIKKDEEKKIIEQKAIEREKEKRNNILLSEGLYEKVFYESGDKTEYIYGEYIEGKYCLFKKVPIEVTDEEFLKIVECSGKNDDNESRNANKISQVIKISSIVLFILNFIGSIFLSALSTYTSYYSGDTYLNIDFDEFNWAIFFSLVIISFFGCLLMYAVGEIIDKLEEIKNYILFDKK